MKTNELRNIIKNIIKEVREPKTMQLLMSVVKSSLIEKLLNARYISDGVQGFVRGKDGNAYEITIKPANQVKGQWKNT